MGNCEKRDARLSIVIPNLLTWDGQRPVLGGLERHARALIRLAVELGYRVDVHQNASFDWERVVDGVPVYGYGLARLSPHVALQAIHRATDRILYASLLFQPTRLKPGSVVVSHGVWWKDPQGEDLRPFEMLELCRDVLNQAALVVSVDYNFLNVMRAAYPRLAHKIEVIPNFVDLHLFSPPPTRPAAPVTILYPRRLDSGPRGLDLFLGAAARVVQRHEGVALLLAVDQNNPAYNQQLHGLLASFPARDRVAVRTFDFEEMPQAYRAAHITVIPSRYSEGTSFSCLEAMACESAVIATDVGGLTNLILDGYNGLLVPPRADSLAVAMERLVTDAGLRRRLARAARATAGAFSLEKWRQRWARVLETYYPLEGRR